MKLDIFLRKMAVKLGQPAVNLRQLVWFEPSAHDRWTWEEDLRSPRGWGEADGE